MTSDRYTKAVLTIIAVSLSIRDIETGGSKPLTPTIFFN